VFQLQMKQNNNKEQRHVSERYSNQSLNNGFDERHNQTQKT
jgi:hypothetical protein